MTRCRLRLAAAAALALIAAGCASSTGSAPPGRTAPGGTPVSGGTAVLAEPPSATPDYIFPFTSSADFSDFNIWDLQITPMPAARAAPRGGGPVTDLSRFRHAHGQDRRGARA